MDDNTSSSSSSSSKQSLALAYVYLGFATGLVCIVVIERFLNAICTLLCRIAWPKDAGLRTQGVLLASTLAMLRSRLHLSRQDFEDAASARHRLHVFLEMEADGSSLLLESSSVKGYASMQLIGSVVSLGTTFVSAVINAITGALVAMSGLLLWAAIVTVVLAFVFHVQRSYPTLLVSAVQEYNESYGPLIYRFIFIPTQMLDVLFSAIVPIYNACIKLVNVLIQEVVIESLAGNSGHVVDFGKALANLCKHTAVQIPSYITTVAIPCDYAKQGDLCYEPGNGRIFDFITIMADLRTMAAAVSRLMLGVCAAASAPLNIVMFPLMDINLAKAVHNIANAILYTLVQLPSVTALRCTNHGKGVTGGGNGTGSAGEPMPLEGATLLMCLPDFNPPINMWAAGIRSMGIMVDNWLDVSSIILQRTLRLLDEGEATCDQQARSLAPAFYSRQLFSNSNNRNKIVVGLTPGLYAITDGVHAQYFNHYDSVDTIASPYVWPIDVDTRYGVAAVTYRANTGAEERDTSTGESTTTMLGCRCIDNHGLPPMRIQCALAMKNVAAASYASTKGSTSSSDATTGNDNDPTVNLQKALGTVFDVVFQQRSTADYMTCAMAQISVQSVRWPATRFTSRYVALLQTNALCALSLPYILVGCVLICIRNVGATKRRNVILRGNHKV